MGQLHVGIISVENAAVPYKVPHAEIYWTIKAFQYAVTSNLLTADLRLLL